MPSIVQAIKQAAEILAESSDSARLDAEILLCQVLGCNTSHLFAWPEKSLNPNQTQAFNQLIEQRLTGVPVAYLIGSKEFWSMNLKVTPDTLIPRPDTETLVEFVLNKFSDQTKLKILDFGTGSGAIAVAIASERPGWAITATDISAEALVIAKENAVSHQIKNIHFIQSNWFEQFKSQRFDLIISNPPYIAKDDEHLSQGDVRFEPASALISGETGMNDIETITKQAEQHLKPNGWLIFEHGYNQKRAVCECFNRNHFQKITQINDLSGQPRLSAGCYRPSA